MGVLAAAGPFGGGGGGLGAKQCTIVKGVLLCSSFINIPLIIYITRKTFFRQ